jgi:hypothetical protein
MYSGQFLETISQSVHAQNLADAERKRSPGAAADELATHRTSITQVLLRQLARIAVNSRLSLSSRLRATSDLTGLR